MAGHGGMVYHISYFNISAQVIADRIHLGRLQHSELKQEHWGGNDKKGNDRKTNRYVGVTDWPMSLIRKRTEAETRNE